MAPPPSPTRVEAGLPSLLAQWFLAPQMFPQILLDPLLTGSPNAKAPASAGAFAIAAGLNPIGKKGPPPLGSGQVLECRGINPAWDQRTEQGLVAGSAR